MKIKFPNNYLKYFTILLIITLIAGAVYYLFFYENKTASKDQNQIGSLNNNISPELEKLADNTVIHLATKDSFVISNGYRIDSQLVDKSILIYPQDQKNSQYNGLESLESLKGILITSAHTVKSQEIFKKSNEEKFNLFKKINPQSDATSQIIKDKKNNEMFQIKQSKPFKMIETILNKEYIIEIASYAETKDYQKIVESYDAAELITENDHKAIVKLHKGLVAGYLEHDGPKVFALLSSESQKNNPIEKVKKSVEKDLFKDMISLEPTALLYFNGNFILQSKVIFDKNLMSRVDISLKVDYDGKTNSWSIDSYSIKNKEKYLSSFELK